MTFTRNTDGLYSLISQENGYVFTDDRNADGSKDGIGHRLYASQSDAQAYFDSVKGGSSSNPIKNDLTITPEMLSGKVFYLKHDENDGSEISYNKLEVISTTQMKVHEIRKNKENGTVTMNITKTFSYSLVNGVLRLKPDGNSFFMDFTLISKDASKWNFSVNENNEETFTDTWYLNKPSDYSAEI